MNPDELQNNLIKECRICFDTEISDDDPLISPCACKGTSKYVHKNCLNQWRNVNYGGVAYEKCMECNEDYVISEKFIREKTDLFFKNPGLTLFFFSALNMLFTSITSGIELYTKDMIGVKLLNLNRNDTKLEKVLYNDPFGCMIFYYTFYVFWSSFLFKIYFWYKTKKEIINFNTYYDKIKCPYHTANLWSLLFLISYYGFQNPFTLLTFLFFYDIGEYVLYYILLETHHISIDELNMGGNDILFSFDDNPLDELENIEIDTTSVAIRNVVINN